MLDTKLNCSTDINECHNPRDNKCTYPERCINIIGNYTCSCPHWKRGDGRKDGTGCDNVNLQLLIWIVVGKYIYLRIYVYVYIYTIFLYNFLQLHFKLLQENYLFTTTYFRLKYVYFSR